jgi:F-type H+-transporting ATPase subunit delta
MNHPRLAERYAKSLVGLATERQQLEDVYKDIQYLLAICKSNRDFVTILRSPVIHGDKKIKVLNAVAGDRFNKITSGFNTLLIKKGRESNLPEIAHAFISQYKAHKKIHTVRLTTAHSIRTN